MHTTLDSLSSNPNVSKRLYYMMPSINVRHPAADDQKTLNIAIKVLKKLGVRLNITTLNKQRFPCAVDYFEKAGRRFAPKDGEQCNQQQNDCAVVIHNNWMVTKEAKVYRFREHLMWMYDGDDEYYSSSTRFYLTYINQAPTYPRNSSSTHEQTAIILSEISALKTAMTIGYLLNRTVILPRFHAEQSVVESPLNSVLHVKSFDDEFSGKYRENSFLRHPKVPIEVKSRLLSNRAQKLKLFRKQSFLSADDIKRHFGHINDRVLEMGSLHNVTVVLKNSSEDVQFNKKLSRAFYHSDYRQYKRYNPW